MTTIEGAELNWYGNDVMLLLDEASDDLLGRLALFVEAEARPEAPVDTGFMRNAIYAITPTGGSGRFEAVAAAKLAAERDLAPEPKVEKHEAAVHGAAEYTVYQELRVGFLGAALERAREEVGGIIKEVGRETFGE